MSIKGLKRAVLLGGLLIVAGNVQAQVSKIATEIGVFAGGSYYLGDLNPNRHFVFSKPAAGLVYRYNLSRRHSLRATAFYGSVAANDADSRSEIQQSRNLSFQSNLLELGLGYEITWFQYRINDMKYAISPYFFYQIAYTRMNPTTEYNGNEIALQPLGTEGQGTALSDKRNYSLNQLTIPLGIGVKFNLKDRVAISVEYGIRKTFTDYLDDVSGNYVDTDVLRAENGPLAAALANRSTIDNTGINRGNPGNKDWYAFYGVMLTINPFKYDVCKSMRGR